MIKFTVVLFLVTHCSYVSSQPAMRILNGDTVNFGKVHAAILSNPIVIQNVGTDTLRIVRIVPTYNGIYAPISKIDIAPQDTALIKLMVNYSHAHGPQSHSFTILSNDSVKQIQIRSNVIGKLEIGKRNLSFGPSRVSLPLVAEIEVMNYTDSIILFQLPTIDANQVELEFKPEDSKPFMLPPGIIKVGLAPI